MGAVWFVCACSTQISGHFPVVIDLLKPCYDHVHSTCQFLCTASTKQQQSKLSNINDLMLESIPSVAVSLLEYVVSHGVVCLGRKQTAHKSLHIHTAPNTLTLHLKRFRPDFIKLTGHIAFPLTLNLAPFLSPDSPEQAPHSAKSQEPAACPHQQPAFPPRATGFAQKGHAFSAQRVTYRLIGVLVHKGSWSSAGHYFSYVLDSG